MRLQTRLFITIVLVVVAAFAAVLYDSYQVVQEHAAKDLKARTELVRNLLMATRRVYHYQFLESGIELNGKTIGFLPAHAMSRISKDFTNWDTSGLTFNNVSDRPRNPEQKADVLESEAIDWFRDNPKAALRILEYNEVGGEPYYFYARPIWVEKYCLKCHGPREEAEPAVRDLYDTAYDYQVGELRGILSIKLPASPLHAEALRLFQRNLAVAGVALLLILSALWYGLRRQLTFPLRRLTDGIAAVTQGAENRPLPELPGEFDTIGARFNTMAETVRRREAQLSESESWVRSLLDSVGEGIYAIDTEGRCILCNRAAAEQLGFDGVEALIGREMHGLIHHHHEDGTPYPVAECPAHNGLTEGRESFGDDCFWRTDGSALPVEYHAVPLTDGERVKGVVVSFWDITQRKEYERELERGREAAEAANLAKSEFLAMISHELRTPLNAILGMGELLGECPLEQDGRVYLETQQRAAQGLLELVNSLLDLTQIESRGINLEAQPFSPRELIDTVSQVIEGEAVRKGLALTVGCSPEVPETLFGDRFRLHQILVNLAGNAVKFTHHGTVHIDLEPTGEGRWRFQVADSGIGIDPEQRERIFQPFVQADTSMTRRYGGSGLGLTIAHRLAVAMGGRVWFESTPGAGTTFFLALPLAESAAGPRPPAPHPTATPRGGEGEGLKILLAEDSADNALLVRSFLKGSGHDLSVVENGEEALKASAREAFDLILMDIQMPVMDGHHATRLIREREAANNEPPTPIVALTAHAFPEEVARSLESGCDAHLAKPIRKQALLEALEGYRKRGE